MVYGWRHKKREMPTHIQSIGFIKTRGIGDLVLASALLRSAKKAIPQVSITAYLDGYTRGMARVIPGIHEMVYIDWKDLRGTMQTLKNKPVDVVIDLGAWPRIDAIFATMIPASYRLGFRTPGQHRHYAYDAFVDHSSTVHESENYKRMADHFGWEHDMHPHLITHQLPSVKDIVGKPGSYVVLHLHPGGSAPQYREWSWDKWRALIQYIVRMGYQVVLTGSQADMQKTQEFYNTLEVKQQVRDVSGKMDIMQLWSALCHAKATVSVNTGVMHLAAASGRPTVGLCGPTSALRWGPIGERAVSVTPPPNYSCQFLDLGFEYKGKDTHCMDYISVEDVQTALEKLI